MRDNYDFMDNIKADPYYVNMDAKEAWFEATLEMKTLDDMDQVLANMKGIVSPAIEFSEFDR